MKIFISADMEGVNGVASSRDVELVGRNYQRACILMTDEVNAVIEGCYQGGASEVVVCDSHNNGDNILFEQLDPRAELIQGDTRTNSMVHGVDETFSGLILLGYHAKFGTENAILDHSFNPSIIRDIQINGMSVGELGFNAYFAAEKNVPLLMVSGDDAVANEAKNFCRDVEIAVVKRAEGRFAARFFPRQVSQQLLRETAEKAVKKANIIKPVKTFSQYDMTVSFQQVNEADGAMRVQGSRRIDAMTVGITAPTMKELMLLRLTLFNAAMGYYDPLF